LPDLSGAVTSSDPELLVAGSSAPPLGEPLDTVSPDPLVGESSEPWDPRPEWLVSSLPPEPEWRSPPEPEWRSPPEPELSPEPPRSSLPFRPALSSPEPECRRVALWCTALGAVPLVPAVWRVLT
jgi:hypothetical protein